MCFKEQGSIGLLFPSLKMKYVLNFFGNISILECRRHVIANMNIEGVKLKELQGNIIELADKVSGYLEILTSGLMEAVTFPLSFSSPELLQSCIDHYDVRTKTILNKDGELVLSISRETMSLVLQLPESTFAVFSPT